MESASEQPGPRFSIVSAVYDVAPYLDDFIASIEAQTYPSELIEVVVVDDGSTDGSLARLEQWQRDRPELVTVLRKPNGGQASARNLGLGVARGEWVTFTDPDDMLEPDAVRAVADFVDTHPETQLAGMRRVLFMDETGTRRRHPLDRGHFARTQLVNLDDDGRFFYGSAPCAFFRRGEIERLGLRFDEAIRPSFEDGYFCDEYLLRVSAPLVGFVADAVYLYRKRADLSSTVSRAKSDPARYTTQFERGYVGILELSERLRGGVPGWLQTHLIYELSYFLAQERRGSSPLVGPVADELQLLLARIAAHLDERWVRDFSLRPFRPEWRELLLHGFTGEPWHSPFAVIDRVDWRQRLVRVTYRYVGPRPDEVFIVDGDVVAPVYAKVRSQPYFARTVVRQRVVWLPYGTLQVSLDGVALRLVTAEPEPDVTVLDPRRARDAHVPRYVARRQQQERVRLRVRWRDRLLLAVAGSRPVRRRYGKAWVLTDGGGSDGGARSGGAARLFAELGDRGGVWFVGASSGRRTVAAGSLRWTLLMLNCEQLITSDPSDDVIDPPRLRRLRPRLWRLVYLLPGELRDAASLELDGPHAEVVAVGSEAVRDALAGDDTASEYTAKEVRVTGPSAERIVVAVEASVRPVGSTRQPPG